MGTDASGTPSATARGVLHHAVPAVGAAGAEGDAGSSRASSWHSGCRADSGSQPGMPRSSARPASHHQPAPHGATRATGGRAGFRRAGGPGNTICLSLRGSHRDFEHPALEAACPGRGGGPQLGPPGWDMAPKLNCTSLTRSWTVGSSTAWLESCSHASSAKETSANAARAASRFLSTCGLTSGKEFCITHQKRLTCSLHCRSS